MHCLDETRVLDWVRGRIGAPDDAQVRAHLARCDGCRRLVAETARATVADSEPGSSVAEVLVGRYVLMEPLGSGSMGVVHLAYDPHLDREVAIKLINPQGRVPAEQLASLLLGEAQTLARLAHPAVVAVHDAGFTEADTVYIVMERVRGATLRQHFASAKRDWREVVDCYLKAGQGLAAAHRAGVVHGDFKPDNVLVGEDGCVKVSDLGLACPLRQGSLPGFGESPGLQPSATPRGSSISGTPAYMAPELLKGHPADARSDLFSFCVSLYESLFGQRPFTAKTLHELARQIARREIHTPEGAPSVPASVRAVVLRGLQADPAARCASMHDLLRALGRARHARRRRITWAIAGVGLLALFGLMALSLRAGVSPCAKEGSAVQAAWNPARRHDVEQAFARSGLSFATDASRRVVRTLSRRAELWREACRELCRSTRQHSEARVRRARLCLNRQLKKMDALVHVFARADRGVVTRSIEAALRLPRARTCLKRLSEARPATPPSSDRPETPQAQRLQDGFARAAALEKAGRYAAAQPLLDALREGAEARHDSAGEAELRALAGRVAGRLGDSARAEAELGAAAEMALASDRPATAARAYVDLMFFVGHAQARFKDARRWDRLARLALDRSGQALELQARRLEVESILLWDQGKLDPAQVALERARDIYQQIYGPQDPRVAHCLDAALALLALRVGEALPQYLVTLSLSAEVNLALGQPQKALVEQERALAVIEQQQVPSAITTAAPLTGMGRALLALGEADMAVSSLQRASDLRATHASDPRDLAHSRFALARALLASGRDDGRARHLATRALQTLERQAWPDPVITELRQWLAAHPAPQTAAAP